MNHSFQAGRLARDLHMLLQGGLSVPDALQRMASRAPHPWAGGLRRAEEAARAGSSLAQALRAAGVFPALLVDGLEVAEDHEPLVRLSELLEQSQWRQHQVRLVLAYPFLLLVSGLALVGLLYGVVGPQIVALFDGMSLHLPFMTLVVIQLVKFFSNPLAMALQLLVVGLLYCVSAGWINPRIRFRLPLVGSWIRRSEATTWLAWVDYFMAYDLSVPEAMRRAASACKDPVFRQKAEAAAAAAERGQELSKAVGRENILPALALDLLSRGETLEFPPDYLSSLVRFLKRELESQSEAGLACLEVLGLLAIVVFIPPMVVGFFLPLYQLLGNL